jgi:hypothetical protein
LEQVRFSSGTSGWATIAFAASTAAAGGTTVRPAPSRAARIRWEPVRERRVAVVPPARLEPIAADCTLLADVDDEIAVETGSVSTTAAAAAGEPHTSQYPSWMWPEHPGWVHAAPSATRPAAGAAADPVPAAGGIPHTSQYPSAIVPVHPGC